MSDIVKVALITAIPTMFATFLTFAINWTKLRKQDTTLAAQDVKLDDIHATVNGKNDALVADNRRLREENARLKAVAGA